jgi:hypothetical protein
VDPWQQSGRGTWGFGPWTFFKALNLVLKMSGSMASSRSETRELNPVINFLKALNFVLKIYLSLAAAWKDNYTIGN